MKLTTPKAILLGFIFIAWAIFLKVDESLVVSEAKAEVAGMDSWDLQMDFDFKQAVEYIVESCDVSGYVDDGYLYSADISC